MVLWGFGRCLFNQPLGARLNRHTRLHTRKSHIPNPAGIRVMCAMRDVCLGHDTNTHTNELSILQLDIRMVDVVT